MIFNYISRTAKLYLFLSGLFLLTATLQAQDTYFQQKVDYRIKVHLNDTAHTLTGVVEMTYYNNAPESLSEIYIHLWANAHQNRETALARQKVRLGDTRLYFASPEALGGYSNLNFTVDGQQVAAIYDKKHPDILKLVLNQPIPSGGNALIRTPFILKIPGSFSRLGHIKTSYQMTQWYPKPAVYDRDGWHPMPYLDMGEFYSEFGSFDVEITLPRNYVVAATGELQTTSEKQFLADKIKSSKRLLADPRPPAGNEYPPSDSITKTIRYTADQIHDFAWFADKRFYVTKDEVTLSSGKKVDTWAFFTNDEARLWKKATDYLNRSVSFYSDLVGAYPYPQATAVQSALSAGAGMEYPMITVIGLSGDSISLDQVITHEVGHNWFYGILASNERDHPWMDEGLNSYYDHRYTRKYYEPGAGQGLPDFFKKGSGESSLFSEGFRDFAIKGIDQAPATPSNEFSQLNYGLGAYEKPAMILRMLERYLGREKLDRAMQLYYQRWQFRHPAPQDLQNTLEESTGESLDWVFADLFGSNRPMDYTMEKIEKKNDNTQLTIKNEGTLVAPFPVTAYREGDSITTQWFSGFSKVATLDFPGTNYDQLIIDADRVTLETDFKNNNIWAQGLFKKRDPLRLKWLWGLDHAFKNNVYWTPWAGYNVYDGPMLGLAIYNNFVPTRKFEYAFTPAFGFNSKDLAGLANLRYNFFTRRSSKLFKWSIGLDAKQFHYNENSDRDYDLKYTRLVPYLRFDFGKSPTAEFYSSLTFKTNLLWEEIPQFSRDTLNPGAYLGNETEQSTIFSIEYQGRNNRAINPFAFKVRLEQQEYDAFVGDQSYIKASLEWRSSYTYDRGRSVDFRFFGGVFLQNDARDRNSYSTRSLARGSFALAHQGFNDYRYDYFYFGRSEQSGLWSQQVSLVEGAFKTALGSAINIGQSNRFIFAVNLEADLPQSLPFNLPLKPYMDFGYFDKVELSGEANSFESQFIFNGGVMLDFFDGIVGIYFPIVSSDNLSDLYKANRNNYFKRITFSLQLHRLNPRRLADGLGRGLL